jgi:hypothetical protein
MRCATCARFTCSGRALSSRTLIRARQVGACAQRMRVVLMMGAEEPDGGLKRSARRDANSVARQPRVGSAGWVLDDLLSASQRVEAPAAVRRAMTSRRREPVRARRRVSPGEASAAGECGCSGSQSHCRDDAVRARDRLGVLNLEHDAHGQTVLGRRQGLKAVASSQAMCSNSAQCKLKTREQQHDCVQLAGRLRRDVRKRMPLPGELPHASERCSG